ncbi:MAG: hypothetical protein WAW03_02000, partial [Anaerolineae bacterium]
AQVKVPLRGAAFPNVAFQRPQSLLLPTYLGDFGPKPPERGAQAHLRAAIPFTFGDQQIYPYNKDEFPEK